MSKHPQTGPVTVEGKEISSRNATTHGGTSEKLIVAGEKQSDFDALLNGLVDEYAPLTEQARALVHDVALARWFLWRRQRAHSSVEAALYAAQPAPELWTPENYQQLALMDRYQTSAERSLQRALRNLDTYNREAARAKREDDAEWQAAHNGFNRPTLVQEINVRRTRDYGAITEMKPTNAAILRKLEQPSRYPTERICRKYYFPHGMPPEYFSFTDNEIYRNERHHTIDQQFTPISFRNLAKDEQALGTGHGLRGEEAA